MSKLECGDVVKFKFMGKVYSGIVSEVLRNDVFEVEDLVVWVKSADFLGGERHFLLERSKVWRAGNNE